MPVLSVSVQNSFCSLQLLPKHVVQTNRNKANCLKSSLLCTIYTLITHWEKLLDSDWLRHCKFTRNLRANSVIRGKLQISRAKSVIHSECKYKQELRINN